MAKITEALAIAMAQFKMPYPASEVVRIEICPVKTDGKLAVEGEKDAPTWCEVCEPEYCNFYGVYARYRNGEAHIIRDLTRPEGIAALFALIKIFGV